VCVGPREKKITLSLLSVFPSESGIRLQAQLPFDRHEERLERELR
jgi:hypothetical protein